jgi:ribosomal-protein-alanine N-acetyltransferase
MDWIGRQPCLIAERDSQLLAALICPSDPPEIAWIRLFAVSQEVALEEAWTILWSSALENLNKESCPPIAAIALRSWFQALLEQNSFEQIQEIVSLAWDLSKSPRLNSLPAAPIRPMREGEIHAVHALDTNAFGPLWRISLDTLMSAYQQACVATVAEIDGELLGYQISTSGPMGGHLARLAVLPSHQGSGIGSALVYDVLNKFERRGAVRVTVNTQRDNLRSLCVYEKAGFKEIGEVYPVYEYIRMN